MLVQCEDIRAKLHALKSGDAREARRDLIRNYQACKRMIRESSAIRIQSAWRGYAVRRPVKSARDPSHSRLVLALESIRKQRESYDRPLKIQEMSLEQLQDDKAFLKRLLNGFDKAFRQKNKRMPNKSEKELYRPIYEEYRAIKGLIANAEHQTTPAALSELTLKRILNEKRSLQIRLNKYTNVFLAFFSILS